MQKRLWLSLLVCSLFVLQNAYAAGESPYQATPPNGSYSQPASGYTQPATGYSQPAGGYSQPSGGYSQPTGGYSQPAAGYGVPTQGYSQQGVYPPAGYIQPPPGYTQQGSGYPQTNGAYGQGAVPAQQGGYPPAEATPGAALQPNNNGGQGPLREGDPRLAPQPLTPAGILQQRQAPRDLSQGMMTTDPALPAGNQILPLQRPAHEKPEPSAIERGLAEEPFGMDGQRSQKFSLEGIEQFGYGFFREDAAPQAEQHDVPVGPDYQVGPGDRLMLTLWGSIEGNFELEVNRSGEVSLPKVGPVKVAGVRYGELPGVLQGQMGRVLKNFQLAVNMSRLHLVKVYVVGEVKAPGDYNVISLSTVINALGAAGGPTKNGSLRRIEIKRGGKLLHTVDLYEFFLKGDKSRDIRLQGGDTIFVPVIGPVAGIAGNVRRPAIYELRGEKSLADLVELAGGIDSSGYLQRIQIQRVEANDRKIVSDLGLDWKQGQKLEEVAGKIPVQDMDMVKVFTIDQTLRSYVRLTGHLLRPGEYALPEKARLSQVLERKNLLPEYFQNAELTRLHAPDYHPQKLFLDLEKALAGDPEHDLELQEFDVIRVFPRWEMEELPTVRVSGEVQRPGEYRLFPNTTLRDLVMQAGNTKRTAYLNSAEISRIKSAGGKVISYPINVNLEQALQGNPKDNVVLMPFDEVTVRRIPNWAEETDRYITLKGEFQFPGTYPIYKGEKLSTLIQRAGGFTDKAYLKAAKFTRQMVREEQQLRMDELLARMEQDIAKKQGELASVATTAEELAATKASLDGLMRSVEKLKASKAEGRMVIQLSGLQELKESPYDLELMGGDLLYVPKTPNSVMVLGQVYNPTTFVQIPGEDVGFYLQKAGGATKSADEEEMYVVRADGTLESRPGHQRFLFFDSFESLKLDSGDTIVVPQRLERVAWMREIKDFATILGQVALTAGVLLAAGL